MKDLGRGSASSDREDDRRNLIPHNGIIKHASNSHSFSTFNISDNGFSSSERRWPKFGKKWYLLLILLPLLLALLYFLVGFLTPSSLIDSSSDSTRESELRALYLLREQQLGLISVLNRTLGILAALGSNSSSNNDNNGNETSGYLNVSEMPDGEPIFEEFKAVIYKVIMLNKKIQQVLLSTNNDGNVSESSVSNEDLLAGGVDLCRKVVMSYHRGEPLSGSRGQTGTCLQSVHQVKCQTT